MSILPSKQTLQNQQDQALLTVQSMLAQNNNAVGAYTEQLNKAGLDSARLAETQKSAIQSQANSAVVISTQEQNAELWAQNTANQIYAAAGGEVAQVAQMQRFKDLSEEMQILQDKKRNMMNEQPTGIWLVDQIVNSISSLDVDEEIKMVGNQLNVTKDLAAAAGQMQEGYARVNALNKQMHTMDTIAANNEKIQAAAEREKAQVSMEQIRFNSENLRAQMAAQNQLIQNTLTGVDVSMKMEDQAARRAGMELEARRLELSEKQMIFQGEQMEHQREQMKQDAEKWAIQKPMMEAQYAALKLELEEAVELSPASRAAKKAQYEKIVADMKTQESFEASVYESVTKAQAVLGMPVESKEVILEKYASPASRERYMQLQEMGMVPNKVIFGATPAKAAIMASQVDPQGLASGSQAMKAHEFVREHAAARLSADPTLAPKTASDQEAFYNTSAREYFEAKSKNIIPGDTTNPYQAPPIDVIASNSPKVASSPLYQKVLSVVGIKETNPQRIADLAASGVKAKLITPEEAAQGITDIFTSAAIYNNTFEGGFERAGFGALEQTSYKTIVKVKPTFMGVLTDKATDGFSTSGVVNPLLGTLWGAVGDDGKGGTGFKAVPVAGKPVNLMNYSDSLLVITKLLATDVEDLPSTQNKD